MEPCELDVIGWARRLSDPNPMQGLDAVYAFKVLLPTWEEHLVRRARVRGEWWMWIGQALGVSGPAVFKRWRERIDEPSAEPIVVLCGKRYGCSVAGHRWRYPRRRSYRVVRARRL